MKYFSTVVPVVSEKSLLIWLYDLGLHLLDDPLPGFVEEFESQLPQPFAQPFP